MPDHRLIDQILAKDPRRQVRFPDLPLDRALAEWEGLQVAAISPTPVMPPTENGEAPSANASTDGIDAALGALATQIWRARNKMVDPTTRETREEMKRVYRHIEGAFDAFAQMGLVLNDWMDQPYDAGLPVKVLSFQPTEGLTRDMILEVVRPTVIWRDRLLQLGEVIVGIPKNSENPSS